MTPDYRAITDEQWRVALDTGLMSPVRFIHAVLDGMVERGFGRIVNIATIAAKYPLELRILSGAPRAALANLRHRGRPTRGAVQRDDQQRAARHVPYRGRAGSVRGARQVLGTTYEQEVEKFIELHQIPAKRFGQPEEIGPLVALLCSVHSGYLTGQSIVVDGATTRSTF